MRVLFFAFALLASTVCGGSSYLFISGAVSPTTIVLDNFVDANGTTLISHVPDTAPAAWVRNTGCGSHIEIQSNAAQNVSGESDSCYQIDAGITTGTLTANVNLALTDTQITLLFNFSGFTDGWALIVSPGGVLNNVYFWEYGGGAQQGVVSNVFLPGAQVWKVVFDASAASFYVDGVLLTSVATPTIRSPTGWGLGFYKNAAGTPATAATQFKVTTP